MTAPIAPPPPPKRPPLTAPLQVPLPPMTTTRAKVKFTPIGLKKSGHRIVLYGTGGIGKTTLACHAVRPVALFDLDESIERLEEQLNELVPARPEFDGTWQGLRNSLQSDGWEGINTIVIDTLTKAEELAIAHTLATVKKDGGTVASSIESYGYGKGYQHVYETFLTLIGDLDRHAREGRNVILICHECVTPVPNPTGDDWIRYEPRLQNPSSGKASIRLRLKEWADHCLFMGYDVSVDKEGKGTSSGSRTIWPSELPHCMAKSRTTQDPIPMVDAASVWPSIIK